jgi:4-hydroxybenzoate polyprenyltransferase
MTGWRDLVELVRLPAALTVPGDVIAGAAAAGWPAGRRTAVLPAASVCLYLAGMALNDYADRHLDAQERPERPIPSGRVRPAQALGLAAGLTAAGVGLAAVAGRRALAVAVPLAGVVWAYDLAAKPTPAGPLVMGAARGLDVVLGAAGDLRAAGVPALVVAGHTVGVTALSRGEVHGTPSPAVPAAALAGTALAAAVVTARGLRGRVPARVASAALAGTYAALVGRAQADAVRRPDAATVRRATGTGIRGLVPLQAALTAAAGAPLVGAALLVAGAAARRGTRVISAT